MKRLIMSCCLFCVILVLFASTAVGEEISIYLSDIDMTISFPEDSIICTRNMSDDDPVLKMIGITPEEVRNSGTEMIEPQMLIVHNILF